MSVDPDLKPAEPGPTRSADPLLPPPFGEATRPASVLVLLFLMLIGMVVVGGITQILFGFAVRTLGHSEERRREQLEHLGRVREAPQLR